MALKKAEVIPVYKKSDKLNISNYRPVSILPILAKVFEKVLDHQITPFFKHCQPVGRTHCSPLLKIGINWCYNNGPKQSFRLHATCTSDRKM